MSFLFFTNASPDFDGQSLALNSQAILSVTEHESGGSLLFAQGGITWYVKEDYLETISALNGATTGGCNGCR
jgi:hypothetical protein